MKKLDEVKELDALFMTHRKKGDHIRDKLRGFKLTFFGWTFDFQYYKEKIITNSILDPVEFCESSVIAKRICSADTDKLDLVIIIGKQED